MTHILSIDQGTTSTRVLLFDKFSHVVCSAQYKHEQIIKQHNYLEHSPEEIFTKVQLCMSDIAQQMQRKQISMDSVACCGITCQRETVVVWDIKTGVPYCNAIVWSDARHEQDLPKIQQEASELGIDIKLKTGLPLSTYFSAGKLRWLIENDSTVCKALQNSNAIIGTVDSWLVYKLTQYAADGPRHVTDVSNASRTLLIDIQTQQWDAQMCKLFKVPITSLPKILPSSSQTGYGAISLKYFTGIKITGVAGDQQASLFGHCCFQQNQSKCTFGTGAFLLTNIGTQMKYVNNGLLTTIAYQLENQPVAFAHEGNIATAGAALEWLAEIGILRDVKEVDQLIEQCDYNSNNITFVPAFSGLFCPHWRADARGVILGLTQFTKQGHIVCATLEAIALQVNDILGIIRQHSQMNSLFVDGGITNSAVFHKILSKFCGLEVITSQMIEITALGAAFLAGLGANVYIDLEDVQKCNHNQQCITNEKTDNYCQKVQLRWKEGIQKSFAQDE